MPAFILGVIVGALAVTALDFAWSKYRAKIEADVKSEIDALKQSAETEINKVEKAI